MREALRRLGLIGGLLGGVGLFTPAEGANFAVKAVKRNATAINPPASSVPNAQPGDTIEVNVFVSGWNANLAGSRIRTFQFGVNTRGGYYNNGGSGFILPKGWKALRSLVPCESPLDCQGLVPPEPTCSEDYCVLFCAQNSDCPPAFPICDLFGSQHCEAAGHNPESGALITESRADWIFKDFVALSAVDTSSLDYDFGGTVISGGDGPLDTGVEKYVGTLILEISPDACGTYSVGLMNRIESSFVQLVSGGNSSEYLPTLQPLTITLPACGACCGTDDTCSETTSALCLAGGGGFKGVGTDCDPDPCLPCPTIVSSDPPNCALDARFPFAPSAVNPRFGFTQLDITFNTAPGSTPTPADFTVVVTPDPGLAQRPVIQSVTQLTPVSFRLNLDPTKPVPTRRWSCFAYNACEPQPRVCVGALPGDTDQDGMMDSADLMSLIDGLNADVNGVNPLRDFQCNMDRGPACTSSDLVNWVDMAVGSLQFPPFINGTIEGNTVCPTAP